MTPEQKAHIEIDKRLAAAGRVLQDKREFNPAASAGIAVREFSTDTDPGSLWDRFNQRKGLPPINGMPDAANIQVPGR